jgi:alpha-L-fucosidase
MRLSNGTGRDLSVAQETRRPKREIANRNSPFYSRDPQIAPKAHTMIFQHSTGAQLESQAINPQAINPLEWFRDAGFGLFIHFGLYALPAGSWKGKQVPYIGEWIMHEERIPIAEYETLAARFNPTRFDAREWVALAEAAGMRYLVFTAKHHDGFAMFSSKADSFNIVDATPFGRDLLAELAQACQGTQVKLAVYYSHCVDWHEAHGANLPSDLKDDGTIWGNDWDFPLGTATGFEEYLTRKVEPQLTEILTGYGDIALIWFDTPTPSLQLAQAQRLRDLVKRLQPNCLVSKRIGHNLGDIAGLGDNEMPLGVCEHPTEACITLNDTWGFKAHDTNWKSAQTVEAMLVQANAKGCNILLNIGPQPDGAFPEAAIDCLQTLAANC